MTDLEKNSSKSSVSLSQAGSCTMGEILLKNGKSWEEEPEENNGRINVSDVPNDIDKNKRQALIGSCPMGHDGRLQWERNTLGEEEEDVEEEVEVLETMTKAPVHDDVGDAQMNI